MGQTRTWPDGIDRPWLSVATQMAPKFKSGLGQPGRACLSGWKIGASVGSGFYPNGHGWTVWVRFRSPVGDALSDSEHA
jgi:hypothetical protein